MNDRVLAQVFGDALKDLTVTALVAEFVGIPAPSMVVPLLALPERIDDIIVGERDAVGAGSATKSPLLAAGGQVADNVASGFLDLSLSLLDAALLIITLHVSLVLVVLVLVIFLSARLYALYL